MTTIVSRRTVPNWDNELELCFDGHMLVAGVDEAGRGAWAGPLVAGAVIFPNPHTLQAAQSAADLSEELAALRDSKMLTEHVRERLLGAIYESALAVGVGIVSPALIDVIGIGPSNRLAMARAIRSMGVWPDYLVIDAFRLPTVPVQQRPIIKGDATCMSIAAASVVAKVTRDRIMHVLNEEYPAYSFAQHKGYGTPTHAAAILREGVTPVHRKSFAPIKEAMGLDGDRRPKGTGKGRRGARQVAELLDLADEE
ncbi:MAG: ribonuclease HII [Chloroflexota bacterium]